MSRWRARARLGLPGLLLALLIPLAAGHARAQAGDSPAIPEPAGFVNDRAGVMDEGARARLEAFLDQLKSKTGVQFAVLVVDSTAPLTPSEYKVKVFERWGIGGKGEDNGLLLLVALREREARFETGYGLEGTVPDGFQSRVVREIMADRFRAGDYAGGITEGVLAVSARIAAEKGVKLEWDGSELRYGGRPGGGRARPGLMLALVVFMVVMVLAMRFGMLAGPMTTSRRGYRGGYWGGGFGGFGGGGFGGGGGGGFGGFGGGASGGGGGGGSW